MTAKHSELPFHSIEHSWSDTGIYSVDGSQVAMLSIESIATEENQENLEYLQAANAEFILRAVNSHDALIAALRAIMDARDDDEEYAAMLDAVEVLGKAKKP